MGGRAAAVSERVVARDARPDPMAGPGGGGQGPASLGLQADVRVLDLQALAGNRAVAQDDPARARPAPSLLVLRGAGSGGRSPDLGASRSQVARTIGAMLVIQRVAKLDVLDLCRKKVDVAFDKDFLAKHRCNPFDNATATLTHKKRNEGGFDKNPVNPNSVLEDLGRIKNAIVSEDQMREGVNPAYWDVDIPGQGAVITTSRRPVTPWTAPPNEAPELTETEESIAGHEGEETPDDGDGPGGASSSGGHRCREARQVSG